MIIDAVSHNHRVNKYKTSADRIIRGREIQGIKASAVSYRNPENDRTNKRATIHIYEQSRPLKLITILKIFKRRYIRKAGTNNTIETYTD